MAILCASTSLMLRTWVCPPLAIFLVHTLLQYCIVGKKTECRYTPRAALLGPLDLAISHHVRRQSGLGS